MTALHRLLYNVSFHFLGGGELNGDWASSWCPCSSLVKPLEIITLSVFIPEVNVNAKTKELYTSKETLL